MGRRTKAAIAAYKRSRKLRPDIVIDELFIVNLEAVAAERIQRLATQSALAEAAVERERLAANSRLAEQAAAQNLLAEEGRKREADLERQRIVEAEAARVAEQQRREEAERVAAAAEEARRLDAEKLRQEAEQSRLAAEAVERQRRQSEAVVAAMQRAKAEQAESSEQLQQEAGTALGELSETANPPSDIAADPSDEVAVAGPVPHPEDLANARSPANSAITNAQRIALVIGNGAYSHAPTLHNPRNDATDVTALLARMGFTVLDGRDLDRDAMEDLMIRFAKAASKAEIALAYYAGHGIQVEGSNYLIPVDAEIEDEIGLRRLIKLEDMVRDTGRASRFGLVLVDACRDNPFEAVLARSLGSVSRSTGPARGLAAPVVPPRVLVAYATGATQTAADGNGRNSPFTSAVLKHLNEPEDIRIVMGRIVDTVAEASQQRQRPDSWNSLGGERIMLVQPQVLAESLEAQLALAERKAVQSSLVQIGLYRGTDDGQFGPAVRRAINTFQIRSGEPATGYLTVEQMVRLHEQARYARGPAPLPDLDVLDLLGRSEAGEADAILMRAKVHDRNFTAGPLPKSMKEAARWYRKAAEAGSSDAALALGQMLQDGDGIDVDPSEAMRWLTTAANAGSAEAQVTLALAYLSGNGVAQDQNEAIRLFKLAAAQERGEAIAQLRALKAWDGQ